MIACAGRGPDGTLPALHADRDSRSGGVPEIFRLPQTDIAWCNCDPTITEGPMRVAIWHRRLTRRRDQTA